LCAITQQKTFLSTGLLVLVNISQHKPLRVLKQNYDKILDLVLLN